METNRTTDNPHWPSAVNGVLRTTLRSTPSTRSCTARSSALRGEEPVSARRRTTISCALDAAREDRLQGGGRRRRHLSSFLRSFLSDIGIFHPACGKVVWRGLAKILTDNWSVKTLRVRGCGHVVMRAIR